MHQKGNYILRFSTISGKDGRQNLKVQNCLGEHMPNIQVFSQLSSLGEVCLLTLSRNLICNWLVVHFSTSTILTLAKIFIRISTWWETFDYRKVGITGLIRIWSTKKVRLKVSKHSTFHLGISMFMKNNDVSLKEDSSE